MSSQIPENELLDLTEYPEGSQKRQEKLKELEEIKLPNGSDVPESEWNKTNGQ